MPPATTDVIRAGQSLIGNSMYGQEAVTRNAEKAASKNNSHLI